MASEEPQSGTQPAWIETFIDAVVGGHSGKTQQLVVALQRADAASVPATLRSGLGAGSAVSRNRAVRSWLEGHRKEAAEGWESFGFPKPPLTRVTYTRAVVLDFDQVLSVVETGLAQLTQAERLVFGGAARVKELDALLGEIRSQPGVALAVVSRNSRHVVEKALEMQPFSQHVSGESSTSLLRHFTPGLVFGFEDYPDSMPKSSVITEKIMRPMSLGRPDVLFVDDMMSNVSDVQRVCGVEVLHVSGGGGMRAHHFEAIRQWLKSVQRDTA